MIDAGVKYDMLLLIHTRSTFDENADPQSVIMREGTPYVWIISCS